MVPPLSRFESWIISAMAAILPRTVDGDRMHGNASNNGLCL
jgi:hypothetical protein